MSFVFYHVDYCDMRFVYGFCDDDARAAVDECQRRFPYRRIPSRGVFSCMLQTMRETGCLLSVAVQSEREVVPMINSRENILEMVQRTPRLSTRKLPLASACHVCRCGVFYMRKIYILIMITRYIWNQGTLLNVWICVTG